MFYIARKSVGTDGALLTVTRCLAAFEIIAIGRSTLERASQMGGRDFEDNVHAAAAVEAAIDLIVTRDPAGFAGAPLPFFSPAELVAQLSAAYGQDAQA